jgi:uncharacterized membrane protein YkvA (DUF1232 family)
VPLFAKLAIPAAIVYLISPVDALPDLFPLVGQLDDIGIILLGLAIFMKLCPSHLVAEHEAAVNGGPSRPSAERAEEPIDAQYRWVGGSGAR